MAGVGGGDGRGDGDGAPGVVVVECSSMVVGGGGGDGRGDDDGAPRACFAVRRCRRPCAGIVCRYYVPVLVIGRLYRSCGSVLFVAAVVGIH